MTKGSDSKPVRRLLTGWNGEEFVVELRERTIVIREKGRKADSAVTLTPGALYQRAVAAHLDARRKRG